MAVFAGLTFLQAPAVADAGWPSAKMVRELFALCLGVADERARLACYDGKAQFLALLAAEQRCNEEALQALAPKMEEAVRMVLKVDPSRADDIMAKAQAIAAAGSAWTSSGTLAATAASPRSRGLTHQGGKLY